MLLNEYVTETLVQIVKGVKDASEQVKEFGGEVNRAKSAGLAGHVEPDQQNVKFDIAVQVTESSTADASGRAKLSVFSIGGGVTNADETHAAHRIQFEVPLALPSDVPRG